MDGNTQKYELMLLLPPELGESVIAEEVNKVKELISSQKGEVIFEDSIGVQRLTYCIKKHNEGYFMVLYFSLGAEQCLELEKTLHLKKNILRYLIVKLPKNVIPKKCEMKLPARRILIKRAQEEAKKEKQKPPVKEVEEETSAKPSPSRKERPKSKTEKEEMKEKEKPEEEKETSVEPKIEEEIEEIEEVSEREAEPQTKEPEVEKSEEEPEKPQKSESEKKASLDSIDEKLQSIIDDPDISL